MKNNNLNEDKELHEKNNEDKESHEKNDEELESLPESLPELIRSTPLSEIQNILPTKRKLQDNLESDYIKFVNCSITINNITINK